MMRRSNTHFRNDTCATSLPPEPQTSFAYWLVDLQGYSYGLLHGLGGLGFVMFHYPAWAVGMYSSGPLPEETPQIQVHPTHVADRMKNPVEGCWLRWDHQLEAKTGRKTTVLQWGENKGCLHLSVCHLDINQSWLGCHTSSERGHSGLYADIKIWTIVQLIGIF